MAWLFIYIWYDLHVYDSSKIYFHCNGPERNTESQISMKGFFLLASKSYALTVMPHLILWLLKGEIGVCESK